MPACTRSSSFFTSAGARRLSCSASTATRRPHEPTRCAPRSSRRTLREGENDLLDLQEAARESGYSPDHLGRLIRTGRLPNAGKRNAPKIRRADLPRRPEVAAREAQDNGVVSMGGSPRDDSVTFERIAREALVSKRR